MNYETDAKDFAELMMGLSETYDKPFSKPKARIYFNALHQFTLEQISHGIDCHLRDPKHGTFMPKPADIIRHLTANEETAEDKAELAWMQVINSISSVGSYGTLKLEDKQAMAAVKNLGSWVGLCQTKECDLQWKKKQFIENYMTFENTPTELLPKSLPGIEDLHNQKQESQQGMKSLMDGVNQFRKNNGQDLLE